MFSYAFKVIKCDLSWLNTINLINPNSTQIIQKYAYQIK